MYEFAPLAELGPHTQALTLVPRAPAGSRASAALSLYTLVLHSRVLQLLALGVFT